MEEVECILCFKSYIPNPANPHMQINCISNLTARILANQKTIMSQAAEILRLKNKIHLAEETEKCFVQPAKNPSESLLS